MTNSTYQAGIVAEAVREYVGDGDGADEEVLAAYEQQIRDQIAAKAWEQGYAASQREWEHAFDGHTVEPGDMTGMCIECGQGNPYAQKEEL